MANVIKKTTNKFIKGLVMDFSPENTGNEVLTHALNATLLTFNGNELSLQNDMGNGRVETAFLPEGYIPVGTCEYGGIIYIVSYNPLEDKSLIGCFPSPERNISNDELGLSDAEISKTIFQNFIINVLINQPKSSQDDSDVNLDDSNQILQKDSVPDGTILNTSHYVLLKNDKLNPGDKFLVCSSPELYDEQLKDLFIDEHDGNGYKPISNPILALNIVSIEDSGKIVYLNSDVRKYNVDVISNDNKYTYKYHILGEMGESDSGYNQEAIDIDSYRNVLSSGYSVFKSKTSGKLAILAELIMIDSYSVTHNLIPKKDNGGFDIMIYSDISPTINENNYNTVPKLQYYYLENSQGHLQTSESNITLFKTSNGKILRELNLNFLNTKISEIYQSTEKGYTVSENRLSNTGEFKFPSPYSYHGRMVLYNEPFTGTAPKLVFTKFTEGKYHRIKKNQLLDDSNYTYYLKELCAKFYFYTESETQYKEVLEGDTISDEYTYYVKKDKYIYHDAKRESGYNTLYECISVPAYASSNIINNKEIEKYQYVYIYTFRSATEEEIENNSLDFFIKTSENVYEQITGVPISGHIYYVREEEKVLKSVGKDIDINDFTEDLYYYPGNQDYVEADEKTLDNYFDFDKYPKENDPPYGCSIVLYYRETQQVYELATESEIEHYKEWDITLYYDTNYIKIDDLKNFDDNNNQMFIVVPMDSYVSSNKFTPNTLDNRINGYVDNDHPAKGVNEPEEGYPKDYPIELYTVADFIPSNDENEDTYLLYNDLKLASIKIPQEVTDMRCNLPFKYDYTLVPCMNYGKLQHLAVSNTIDFSKLSDFESSDFTTWKYRIDGNLLRLTFGAEIFDTYEDYKIDGLVLEFYDYRGFAGSYEINNKKAYSGIFTKIFYLNTLNTLNKNKISGNEYSSEYKRNINISLHDDGSFKFGDTKVSYINDRLGWDNINDEDNDCGVLYSNILYGVKTYLRRTLEDGTLEFIPKRLFFLYTLPIYNDFYYKCDDFSSLENPSLKMTLTYKLEDKGGKQEYNNGTIVNGYNQNDLDLVNDYLKGNYSDSELDVIKYYNYSGNVDLYLEIGLNENYNSMNITYDPNINKYFTTKLQLISDSDSERAFDINSENPEYSIPKQFLNYPDDFGDPYSINTLKFSNNKTSIDIGDTNDLNSENNFINSNYITSVGLNPIKINYNFIVGYKIKVDNFAKTEIPATTVCALCYKKDDGSYNYEDFGILYNSDNDTYLSQNCFYNQGSSNTTIFGLCNLISAAHPDGTSSFFAKVPNTEISETSTSVGEGILNLNVITQLSDRLGKYLFCQPHVHTINTNYGTNVGGLFSNPNDMTLYGDLMFAFPPIGLDHENDTCKGIFATSALINYPIFSLSLNSLGSLSGVGKFVSTVPFGYTTGDLPAAWVVRCIGGTYVLRTLGDLATFIGITPYYMSEFNKYLVKVMKDVYAYNPDYDNYIVNKGTVSLQDNNSNFTSNIVCNESKFDFKNYNFNNFICFGNIKVSKYLEDLNYFSLIIVKSGSDFLPQVLFIPDLYNCGFENNYCLLSTLTFNTPVPSEISEELEMTTSKVILRTENEVIFIDGELNKNCLYGYDSENRRLILLDVSNYKISRNPGELGKLELKTDLYSDNKDKIINVDNTTNYYTIQDLEWPGVKRYIINKEYKNACLINSNITLNDLIYKSGDNHKLYIDTTNCVVPEYTRRSTRRPIIYYRSLDQSSWKWSTSLYNRLFLYEGLTIYRGDKVYQYTSPITGKYYYEEYVI